MTRRLRIPTVVLALALAAPLATTRLVSAGAEGDRCDPGPPAGPADGRSELALGRGLAAIVGDRIVSVRGPGERTAYRHAGSPVGLLRHVASAPGAGTAYVNDLEGPDRLVMVGVTGVRELREPGEVSHPAFSPTGLLAWALDMARLRLLPAVGPIRDIRPPEGSTAAFSPLFTGPATLVAVVQEPAAGYAGHEDALNNLWAYHLAIGRWERLTDFAADGDRWSVIRTPVIDPDGAVMFVRIAGRGSATEPPAFELWTLAGGGPRRVRGLPGEAFLAGWHGGLVWNVFDEEGRSWSLAAETPDGPRLLGCGAVSVDPRSGLDPDLLDDGPPEGAVSGPPEGGGSGAHLGIVVGDFPSWAEAERVAGEIGIEGLRVVGHEDDPGAVAPDAWAVVLPLGPAADPSVELARFREAFPAFADRSWITALAGGFERSEG